MGLGISKRTLPANLGEGGASLFPPIRTVTEFVPEAWQAVLREK